MQFQTRLIQFEECLPLRQSVLRPYASLKECIYEPDNLASSFHVGLFSVDHPDKILSIASYHQEPHPEFNSLLPYRLRGMATATSFQGQGLGSICFLAGEKLLIEKGCDFLWFNARQTAFGFYQKHSYELFGELFDIPRIGPHKVMYKFLINR